AVLSNPMTCGEKTVTSEITSHGGIVATPSSSFTITGDCGRQTFGPNFVAGVDDPTAGEHSNFTLSVSRSDLDAELKSLRQIKLPEGLLGDVGSVPLCDEAQAAAGTCSEASRIG